MKTLLKLSFCVAALLPFTQVQASEPAITKLYGGFAPGKIFTRTVTDVTVAKASLFGGTVSAKVPLGVPKFQKGDRVKFKIGSRGQLTGRDFSIAFGSGSGVSNAYADKVQSGSLTLPDIGIVYKNRITKQPEGVALNFFKITGSGFSTATYTIIYTLE